MLDTSASLEERERASASCVSDEVTQHRDAMTLRYLEVFPRSNMLKACCAHWAGRTLQLHLTSLTTGSVAAVGGDAVGRQRSGPRFLAASAAGDCNFSTTDQPDLALGLNFVQLP